MIGKIQKLKNKKGFTLVELIVVIAIIAILTAVIVPLIARYSAQAQYTTLQDAAQTISNSANNALSDGNQISALNVSEIYGKKTANGELEIKIDSAGNAADGLIKGTEISTAAGTESSSGDKAKERAAKRLFGSLLNTLPNNCRFYIKVSSSAVSGVVYQAGESSTHFTGTNMVKTYATIVTGFDNAYSDGSNAIGVSGIFKDNAKS